MKKILATGGMLAYMLWFNSTGAMAATLPEIIATDIDHGPKYHTRAAKYAEKKLERLAQKFHLDPEELAADLDSGKSIKEILKKHGITKNQLRELKRARRIR